jgi:proline iminopeptidase
MKKFYPEIEPFQTFFLETGTQHSVYVEQSGNPDGQAVIFLHGGPCSGTRPDQRRFFNPEKYRIILFDQRSCGLSVPFGELDNNTTQDLLDDMERIRKHLDIQQWLLFGGSWGATLALLYAQQHIENVKAMILRGVFLARKKDLDWFLQEGAGRIYPEQYQRLVESIPKPNRSNLIDGLWERLWSDDEVVCRQVAREWEIWGSQVALGSEYKRVQDDEHVSQKMVKQARMEIHFARNNYFLEENQILRNCHVLKKIPTVIIHGRYDLVCPMEAGLSLYQTLPDAEYIVLPNSGHIAQGEEMIDALVTATDKIADKSSL